MRLEATNKNVRGGLNKPPPLTGRVKVRWPNHKTACNHEKKLNSIIFLLKIILFHQKYFCVVMVMMGVKH